MTIPNFSYLLAKGSSRILPVKPTGFIKLDLFAPRVHSFVLTNIYFVMPFPFVRFYSKYLKVEIYDSLVFVAGV